MARKSLARPSSFTICGFVDTLHRHLTFASDAEIAAFWAFGFLVLALFAFVADRRQTKRGSIEKVGMIPWTGVFLGSLVIAGGIGMLAIKGLAAG